MWAGRMGTLYLRNICILSMSWAYIRIVFGISWSHLGHILAISLAYLSLSWPYFEHISEHVLDIYWEYIWHILDTSWTYLLHILGLGHI